MIRFAAILPALLIVGCASVDALGSFEEVQGVARDRLGARLSWIRGTADDARVRDQMGSLLAQPLTLEASIQIALLNNRSLQAEYEELGLAQAELVQAGLLKNPIFSGSARYPTESPRVAKLEFDLVGSFLDLLFLPARQQTATLELEERKLRVSHAVLEVASQTRTSYYRAISARQVADLRKLIAEASEASAEFVKRLHDAGNISELALTQERDTYEQARLDWSRAESGVVEAREALTRLMGLWGESVQWKAPEKLPDVPADELPVEHSEKIALSRRLDFQAALRDVQAAASALGLAQSQRWFGEELDIGVSYEKETQGDRLLGPAVGVQIPLFDQGQSSVAGGAARLRQREHRLAAMAVNIRSEVRNLRDRLLRDRQRVEHILRTLVPLRERAVALTQERYNFMLGGTPELLTAKKREFDAYQEYIEAVRDYWISRSEFLHAIGGSADASK